MDNKKTLNPEDIVTTRNVGRRSALRSIAGTVLGAAALVAGSTVAAQQAEPLCSDSDPNDPVGRGRHCTDPAGRGTSCSDSDPNDPGGNGRRCSDSD